MRVLLFLLMFIGLTGCSRVYRDADEDSFGDPDVWIMTSSSVSGYVLDNTDCDDSDAAVNPAATESSNGIDDNCNGTVDETGDTGDTGDTGAETGLETGLETGADSADTASSDSGSSDTADTAVVDTGDTATDSGGSDSGADTAGDTADSGSTDSGGDSGVDTGSLCPSDESIVHIEFDAPGGSTDLYVWGEVWTDSGTKSGINIIPQGTWATDWVPGLTVTVSGTHAEVDYSECVADADTWFMTFAFKDASGNAFWSCNGIDSSSTTIFPPVFTEDGVVNPGDVYYKSGSEGSGCELSY